MRKTLTLLFVIFISVLFLYAAPYTGSELTGNATLTLSSDLTTIFKQGSTSAKHSLAVGYTLNNKTVTGETITPIGSDYQLVLSESFSGDQAEATGSIYAFFRVASLDSFTVSLSWDSLKKSGSTEKIDLTINGQESGSVFYAFNPSTRVMDDYRLLLNFATEKYLNNNYEGTYTTTITMTIAGI